MVKVKEDLTGRQFGRLKVLKQVDDYVTPGNRHMDQWLCECSCSKHSQIIVIGSNLRSGNVKSCGCYRKERMVDYNKKYNQYELNLKDEYGIYGIGYCFNTNSKFYFDMNDYDKIKNCCWYESIGKDGYHRLTAHIQELDAYKTMAQIVVGNYFDHKDRNPLNNRKYNLRKANLSENARNKTKQRNNTSGIAGVGWHKTSNAWYARIAVNNRSIWLGTFASKEDAIKARLIAEHEYFGEFAPQQHLFEQYKINKEGENI